MARALDLGADDVLSIPFEPMELSACIRAELREKAPDDRLRQEVVEAHRREHEAQTTHGGSGGPVFNSSGKVIGVNVAILADFSGSNFAVPIVRAARIVAQP